ncbi:MAG TPA: hypothetical protein VFQ00_03290 [Terriglobales bacterium]|nr:hypothetical protein [Terriglobales bacterium]
MANPVWVLSVDLQTKTATFQSGMAEAAKSARGAFTDIKRSAGEMSEGTSKGFGDIRHSLGLLDNSIRGQHGAAMADAIRLTAQFIDVSAALPYAAITGGFLLIGGGILEVIKKYKELKQAAEATRNANLEFGTAVDNVYNGLTEKLLQAGIKADELNKDHLAALHKQLELIDMQTMSDLVHSFAEIDKASDAVFKQLQANWYTLGIGSEGAKHALDEFKVQYDALLAQGKDKEASDLLSGTLASAHRVMDAMNQLRAFRATPGGGGADGYEKAVQALNQLKANGISASLTDAEYQSQQKVIEALNAQVTAQEKVNALKGLQKGNVTHAAGNAAAADALARFRQEAEAERKGQEDAQRQQDEAHKTAVAALEQGEREKIEVTDKGSAERLAAIAAALKEEEKYGLQETSFYGDLSRQKIQIITQMADEEKRLRAEADRETANDTQRMAEIAFAAQQENEKFLDSARRVSLDHRIQDEIDAANRLYEIKLKGFDDDIAALDKSDKDYQNKLRAIQDREKQLRQQHENEITAIQDKAAMDRNNRILSAYQRFDDAVASGLTSVLMRQQSFAKMTLGIADQVAAGMMQNAIKDAMLDDFTREKDAAAAARKMFIAGTHFPFPANLVMPEVLAAGAFAAVMAFDKGGIVPGVGNGDVVPAMLTPGEAVINKKLTEGLTRAADSGNMGGGHTFNMHYRPTFHVHAIDRSGVREMLDKHTDEFQRHAEKMLRNLNRG